MPKDGSGGVIGSSSEASKSQRRQRRPEIELDRRQTWKKINFWCENVAKAVQYHYLSVTFINVMIWVSQFVKKYHELLFHFISVRLHLRNSCWSPLCLLQYFSEHVCFLIFLNFSKSRSRLLPWPGWLGLIVRIFYNCGAFNSPRFSSLGFSLFVCQGHLGCLLFIVPWLKPRSKIRLFQLET